MVSSATRASLLALVLSIPDGDVGVQGGPVTGHAQLQAWNCPGATIQSDRRPRQDELLTDGKADFNEKHACTQSEDVAGSRLLARKIAGS